MSKIEVTGGALSKGLIQTAGFHLEDTLPLIQKRQVLPTVLDYILRGIDTPHFLTTETFRVDLEDETNALPEGKSYSEFGPTIGNDKPTTETFAVPSFGIRFTVAPADYANRRQAGQENLFEVEANIIRKQQAKLERGWKLFREGQLMSLLVNDTNDLRGGRGRQYNFSQTWTGQARPNNNINFTAGDAIAELRAQKAIVQEASLKAGAGITSGMVVICGSDFFQERFELEQFVNVTRELRTGLDLLTQALPEFAAPTGGFPVEYFVGSQDGLTYINYSASIGGVRIPATKAYLVPVQIDDLLFEAFAPAQTRTYVNTEAQRLYGWSGTDERVGVAIWEESNVLYGWKHPELIRELTAV